VGKDRWLAFALVLVAGCMPPQPADVTKPKPDEVVSKDFDSAAKQFIADYSIGLSNAASHVAEKAKSGGYADSVELDKEWATMAKKAHIDAQNVLRERMNTVASEEPGSPKMVDLFQKMAEGFKRGAAK